MVIFFGISTTCGAFDLMSLRCSDVGRMLDHEEEDSCRQDDLTVS